LLPSEPTAPQRKAPAGRQSSDSGLSKAERQLLIALAQRQPKALEQEQLAVFSGYSVGTGHFNNTVGALRSKEYITKGWPVSILPAGLEALGDYERLPTGRALLDWWCGRLSKAERAILLAAAHVYPNALSKDELAGRAGYESGTGHFNNSLGRLRTLQLLSGRGEIKASENLFS
jgi:inorganic triphosphatase YgiF